MCFPPLAQHEIINTLIVNIHVKTAIMARERERETPSSNLRSLMTAHIWTLQTQMTLLSNLSVCVVSSQSPTAQGEEEGALMGAGESSRRVSPQTEWR